MANGKYAQMWKKMKADAPATETSNRTEYPRLPWYNINKAVNDSKDGRCAFRVLPLKGHSWNVVFRKHTMTIGQKKNALCISGTFSNGEYEGDPIGKCPICEFHNEHAEELADNEHVGELRARQFFAILIYDHLDKQLKRVDLNWYEFNDILEYLVDKTDDATLADDVDNEGFNAYFAKQDNGYAKLEGVKRAKISVEKIKDSLGIDELPDLVKMVLPWKTETAEKQLQGMLELAIQNDWFPEVDVSSESKPKATEKRKVVDDEDDDFSRKPVSSGKSTDEDLDDIMNELDAEAEEKPKAKKTEKKAEKETSKKAEESAGTEEKEEVEEVKPKKTTVMDDDDELDKLLEEVDGM